MEEKVKRLIPRDKRRDLNFDAASKDVEFLLNAFKKSDDPEEVLRESLRCHLIPPFSSFL